MPADELDTKNSAILQLLKNIARLVYSKIGEQAGLSRTAISTRSYGGLTSFAYTDHP